MPGVSSSKGYGIGALVREARRGDGLRQSDLSEMTGLQASHLSDIERGAIIPTIPTLDRIAQALSRPLVYFLQDKDSRLRSMGMGVSPASIGGMAAARFAELVEEKTGGDNPLRIYQLTQLGTAGEQVQCLAAGAIHIYINELHNFEPYAELCGPVFLPYFFRDREHYHRFLHSDIFELHIYQKLLDHGIRLLGPDAHWESGSFELLFSTEPVFTPADLVGRRIRSYASPAAIALRRALGVEPVVIEWECVEEAYQQGLIDAILVPAAYFSSHPILEFTKFATLLNTGYTLDLAVAVSEREYRKLPPSVQTALTESAQEAAAYCTQLANEQTVIDLENLPGASATGVSVIRPHPGIWRSRFTDAIRQICDEGLLARGMYEELHNL